jgi:hypothetical protein
MNALVVGWFSFQHSDFTAGDLLASSVCRRLRVRGPGVRSPDDSSNRTDEE